MVKWAIPTNSSWYQIRLLESNPFKLWEFDAIISEDKQSLVRNNECKKQIKYSPRYVILKF